MHLIFFAVRGFSINITPQTPPLVLFFQLTAGILLSVEKNLKKKHSFQWSEFHCVLGLEYFYRGILLKNSKFQSRRQKAEKPITRKKCH